MLARTFLTAKKLKISEIERQAALKLLDMLERGKIKYAKVTRGFVWKPDRSGPSYASVEVILPHGGGLNMACWGEVRAGPFCGCLGGWIERIKGREISERCFNSFEDLFEPEDFDIHPERYTPEVCARALHAKLTTGKAQWD